MLESHGTYDEKYGGSHYLTQQAVQALIAMYDAWAEDGIDQGRGGCGAVEGTGGRQVRIG